MINVFQIPVLRGRNFTENDNAGAAQVVLINEAFARKFFPNVLLRTCAAC